MNDKQTVPRVRKPETRLQKSVRGALRWLLVALLVFGLGALIIALVFYLPARQKLNTANVDLERANATITEKTAQITTLQQANATLQADLASTTLHMVVLDALSGVRAASLAVAANDYAGARLSLTQASEALDILSDLVEADQQDVLAAMQQSAAQALVETKTELASVQPHLDLLTENLVLLENNLFPNPIDGQSTQSSPTYRKSAKILYKIGELSSMQSHWSSRDVENQLNTALPRESE